MSLPESLVYGGAIGAQIATSPSFTLNKANFGSYVQATNALDEQVALKCYAKQSKTGVLDAWVRFEQFRNLATPDGYGGWVPSGTQSDRNLSIQIRAIGPLSTNPNDGRFSQAEILQRFRAMGSIVYEANFLERLLRGEL